MSREPPRRGPPRRGSARLKLIDLMKGKRPVTDMKRIRDAITETEDYHNTLVTNRLLELAPAEAEDWAQRFDTFLIFCPRLALKQKSFELIQIINRLLARIKHDSVIYDSLVSHLSNLRKLKEQSR